MIYCEKITPRKMGEVLAEELKNTRDKKLARRAWNRFEPTYSPWWLVPSPKQPHYQFGKYYCSWGDESTREDILISLHIEKGLAPAIKEVYPSKKGRQFIVNDKWAWNDIFRDIQNGDFFETIKQCAEQNPVPIEIHLAGGYIEEPSLFDPYNPNYGRDYYILIYDKDSGRFSIKCTERKAMVLKKLNQVRGISDLQEVMIDFGSDPWLWLDIYVAIRLKARPESGFVGEEAIYTTTDIDNNFLIMWDKYVR